MIGKLSPVHEPFFPRGNIGVRVFTIGGVACACGAEKHGFVCQQTGDAGSTVLINTAAHSMGTTYCS